MRHGENDVRLHALHNTSITIHVRLYTSSILLGRLAVLHSLCPLQLGKFLGYNEALMENGLYDIKDFAFL